MPLQLQDNTLDKQHDLTVKHNIMQKQLFSTALILQFYCITRSLTNHKMQLLDFIEFTKALPD